MLLLRRRPPSASVTLSQALLIGVAVAAVASQTAEAAAQRVVTIGPRASCPECSIELEHLARIEDDEADPWLGDVLFITEHPSGRLYATSPWVYPGRIVILDAQGRRIGEFGRGVGDGPGEFRLPMPPLFDASDSAYVYDALGRGVTVWSPERTLARTFRAPPTLAHWLITSDGSFVVAGLVSTREAAGFPVHIVDDRPDASRLTRASFGVESPSFRYDETHEIRRKLARSGSDRIWAARVREYAIEQWTLDGRKLLEIRREADWFPEGGGPPGDGITSLRDIWEDEDGLLWVRIAVPHEEYRQRIERLRGADGIVRIPQTEHSNLYRNVIEVLDPASGRLLASHRFNASMTSVGDGHPLVIYRPDATGYPRFDVYRAVLRRPGSSQRLQPGG